MSEGGNGVGAAGQGDAPKNAIVPAGQQELARTAAAPPVVALVPQSQALVPPPRDSRLQRGIGVALIALGMAGFVAVAVLALGDRTPTGQVPAIALLLLILGMAFFFPSLLREPASPDGAVSTMRVLVLVIIGVFALLNVCNGWSSPSFKLDQYWVWIVFVAIGGKAGQRAVELLVPAAGK